MPSFTENTTGNEVVQSFPDQVKGKIAVITGASKGSLGAETALSLARGSIDQLVLIGRTESKIVPVIEQIHKIDPNIQARFQQLDFADLASVRVGAEETSRSVEKIDILVNSAGVMALNDFQKSKDGIEMQFAVAHVGHFLFTNLLMDKIVAAGEGARIVNVTSAGYQFCGVNYEDWNFKDGKEYSPWHGYGQAKSANVLFAQSLADRLKESGGQAFSAHPGYVPESSLQSNSGVGAKEIAEGLELGKKKFGITGDLPPQKEKTLQQGSATILFAALSPDIKESSGANLVDCSVAPIMDHATGEENKQKLWSLSEKLVGQAFA